MAEYIFSPQQKRIMEPFMKYLDPARTGGMKEIVINKPGEVGYEDYQGEWHFEKAPELTEEMMMDIIKMLAEYRGLEFSLKNPILSFMLPGGHRAQIVAGLQNAAKFSMAVRIHHKEKEFTIDDYIMSDTDKHAVISAIKSKKTLLISGGTGSGKTTFMNAVLRYIGEDERLVTIEDVLELKVPQPNTCSFTFGGMSKDSDGPSVTDILNACLRMRPDRILLGEVRQENAFTFCSAINTGHAGSMATIHANDPKSAIDAVINRVMLNGDVNEAAMNVLKRQLETDIYAVVQLDRVQGGVEGYFQVLDPDRADREKKEAILRQQQNLKAAADNEAAEMEKEARMKEHQTV
ncbi:MAG: type IV secretion system protein VirB11 [Alphaproteobacteria bacterium]|jgi:type IV secretion system protein VirB11